MNFGERIKRKRIESRDTRCSGADNQKRVNTPYIVGRSQRQPNDGIT